MSDTTDGRYDPKTDHERLIKRITELEQQLEKAKKREGLRKGMYDDLQTDYTKLAERLRFAYELAKLANSFITDPRHCEKLQAALTAYEQSKEK